MLNQIMVANLKDNGQSWHMQSDGRYFRSVAKGNAISAHQYCRSNPSLSGRGQSLKHDGPQNLRLKK